MVAPVYDEFLMDARMTRTLAAIALLSAAVVRDPAEDAALQALPGAIQRAIEEEPAAAAAAATFSEMESCTVLGRGFEYATAREWALFAKRFRAEMAEPLASRTLDLLAALSHTAEFSVGCYCEDEARCHRSALRELLAARGARMG